jgi:CheY-like chemotaxis protein
MSNNAIKILLVEDNLGDAGLLREVFKRQRSQVIGLTHVECMSDAEKQLAENEFDIILLDLGLPDAQGLGAVRRCGGAAPLRLTSPWWCSRAWTTKRSPDKSCMKAHRNT